MRRREKRTPPSPPPTGPRPWRTCLGCRGIRSQGDLLRLVCVPGGTVEPDPRRERGGRGAYLCRRQDCLAEAVRRARWAQAFRTPATLRPETIDRVRTLIEAEEMPRLSTECAGAAVEGRW